MKIRLAISGAGLIADIHAKAAMLMKKTAKLLL